MNRHGTAALKEMKRAEYLLIARQPRFEVYASISSAFSKAHLADFQPGCGGAESAECALKTHAELTWKKKGTRTFAHFHLSRGRDAKSRNSSAA
jgi:hypothetical protein